MVLHLIWTIALVLIAGSLIWMSTLILLRLAHARRTTRRQAARKAVDKALVALLLGKCDIERELGPYRARGRLMAEALLEFLSLVRGHDRAMVIAALQSLGVDRVLHARLERGSPAGRLAAAEALAAFPGLETERALTRMLSRADPPMRLVALKSLVAAGGGVTLPRLLADLRRGALQPSRLLAEFMRDLVVADPAAAAGALQSEAVPQVKAMLLDALGACGDYAALPAVLAQASDAEPEVRAAAVGALGRLKHPAARASLAAALDDVDPQVRAVAADAVGEAGLATLAEPLAARLVDPVWRVRFLAAAALTRLGVPGLSELHRAAAGDEDLSRHAASLALAERGLAA